MPISEETDITRALVTDGASFAAMLRGGAAELYAHKGDVNDLNVFPVPDGDTGDNMYMTLSAGATAACTAAESGADLWEVAERAAHGMLLGARGNSGVILSRFFAGIAEELKGSAGADTAALGKAFARGVEEAYGAVAQPTEGTILTVCREAVTFANREGLDGRGTCAYFEDLIAQAGRSLEATPDLLAVLKEAGVVDSGGAGLLYVFMGMSKALRGEESAVLPNVGAAAGTSGTVLPDVSRFGADDALEYGYCTEFLLRLQTAKNGADLAGFDMEGFTAYLNRVGDSVVAFRDGSIVKVHVHTMRPGDILNECQKYGEFLTLKIENMTLQHNETAEAGAGAGASDGEETVPQLRRAVHKAFGVVAVAAGEGIRKTFLELGVDVVVNGGQCMNPSAEDLVKAFSEIDADHILVLPNNGNVILTARQAAEIFTSGRTGGNPDANVTVMETHTVGDGYAVLSMLDTSSGDLETILAGARDAMEGVVTGQVSAASRDTARDGFDVHKGDFIGFTDDRICSCADDRRAALLALAENLDAGARDVLILICGSDATEEDADFLYAELQKRYRRTETILLDGGQPVYDFILVLE